MKFAYLKSCRVPAGIISFIIIVYLYGLTERSHPESHYFPFDTLISQPDNITCGPASTTMVLGHYGKVVTVDEVKKKTWTVWFQFQGKDIGMTHPNLIHSTLNFYQIPATLKHGNIETLKHDLSKNRPCIVLLRSGKTTWHYAVLYGYSYCNFYCADPGNSNNKSLIDIKLFEKCWNWQSDLSGKNQEQYDICTTLLKTIEVYPNTYIVPHEARK